MTGQLYLNENGRLQIDNIELTCGDSIKVLIVDGKDNCAKWIDTTVEHNGDNYYLSGLWGYSPIGLFAVYNV